MGASGMKLVVINAVERGIRAHIDEQSGIRITKIIIERRVAKERDSPNAWRPRTNSSGNLKCRGSASVELDRPGVQGVMVGIYSIGPVTSISNAIIQRNPTQLSCPSMLVSHNGSAIFIPR